MLVAEAAVVVKCGPEAILDWVVDLDRYRQADTKITKVLMQSADRVVFRGRLRGLPTPADENLVHHDRGRSLTFVGAPRWTRRVLDFTGSFVCEPVDGGTLVTHREELTFKPWPVRVVAEWWLRRWAAEDIIEEMERLRTLIEADVTQTPRAS